MDIAKVKQPNWDMLYIFHNDWYRVEVRLSLWTAINWEPKFSVMWEIYKWNVWECWGQIINEIDKLLKYEPTWLELRRLWELYHLNDMHPWTPKQEKWLNEHWIKNYANHYDKVCALLEWAWLLVDKYKGKDCKFWSGWYYWDIPEKDLETINELMSDNFTLINK